jgi:hypothetical protein
MALEEVLEIMLNLKIESVLFLSIVTIVQFILVLDCVEFQETVENLFRLKISVRPRVWRVWRRHPKGLCLRRILVRFCRKRWRIIPTLVLPGRTEVSEGRNVFTTY